MKKSFLFVLGIAALTGLSSAARAETVCFPANDGLSMLNCGGMGQYCVDDDWSESCMAAALPIGSLLGSSNTVTGVVKPKFSLPMAERQKLFASKVKANIGATAAGIAPVVTTPLTLKAPAVRIPPVAAPVVEASPRHF